MMPTVDLTPLWLSLRVAIVATFLTTAFGLPIAWLLARRRFRGRGLLSATTTLPLVLPPTVLGYYLLLLLGRQGPVGGFLESQLGFTLVFTWYAAVIASSVVSLPLLVRAAQGAFEGVNRELEDAARTLGRSGWSVFLTVTLPLARRGILAGLVLAFARAMGEFGATLMVAGSIPGSTQTMPIAIYDAVQGGHLEAANLLVLAISVATLIVVLAAERTQGAGNRP
ncbi:MAG: molybdate ABC transporter permease subunit [Chloroflexota bacterium]